MRHVVGYLLNVGLWWRKEGRSLIQASLDSAMKQVGPPYFEQIRALFDNKVAHQVVK
jgi:hypothetical protein